MIVALGDILVDVTSLLEGPIAYGADTFVRTSVSPGGSAANFAVWASRLGADVGFIGKVGGDVLGRYLRDDLHAEGVVASVAIGPETTGICLALVDDRGERSMLPDRGASGRLAVTDLDWGLLDRARLLHLTGYSFLNEPCRGAALAAARRVKRHGGTVSLDTSSCSVLRGLGAGVFRELSEDAHILFPNLEEARVLTGEPEPDRALRTLAEIYEVVALKLGAEGARGIAEGEVVACPAPRASVVDTTGAGDAFAAAFVVQWLGSMDLRASLTAAVSLASKVVQHAGARSRVVLEGAR